MSMHVKVVLDDDEPIAVKSATGDDDRARLRLEIERLGHAAHPGLVTVVTPPRSPADANSDRVDSGDPGEGGEHAEDGAAGGADGEVELRTRFAGDPLSRWSGAVASVAGLGAAVAATLADLHAIDIVHGRLDSSHILVGEDGRPRLCGLSHPGGATPEDDVAALGHVLSNLLERSPAEPRPLPWPPTRATDRRHLERVIAWALDPVPSRRPSARLLSRAILDAVPGAELPEGGLAPAGAPPAATGPAKDELLDLVFTHEQSDDERWAQAFGDDASGGPPGDAAAAGPPPRSSRGRVIAGSGVVAAAALAGVVVVTGWGSPGSAARQDVEPEIVPAGRPGCPAVEAPAADVDGDGCAEELVVEGRSVTAGPHGWTLGEPGDLVAVGDWECDGYAAALLRPKTGDVFVFPGWAGEDQPLTVEARDRLPGAVAIRASTGSDGCDDLVVELESGATTTVEVRS